MVGVLLFCSLLWEKQPRRASPVGEGWAAGTASWAAGPVAAAVAGLAAAGPSEGAGALRSLETTGTVALVALVVQDGETGAAAADGACDEASVVFLGSKGPGFGGRCLPERPQGRPAQTAPTISYTWVWRSTLVFQICTNVPQDTSLPLL